MKRAKIRNLLIVSSFLFGIVFNLSALLSNDWLGNNETNDDVPNPAWFDFELNEEFEASTYYISPQASPGRNDGVFFSWEASKEGNYTVQVNYFPNQLTDTAGTEKFVSFDNPSQTDLWYLCYIEKPVDLLEDWSINLLTSSDFGDKWNNTQIAQLPPEGQTTTELKNFLMGSAIAAFPQKQVIGVVYWAVNSTGDINLNFISSTDNGSSWNLPMPITNDAMIGERAFDFSRGWFPKIEIAILKNQTIYVLSETWEPSLSSIVYFESHDNGTSWSGAKNITLIEGEDDICKNPRVQVDHISGDYWLMYYKRETITTWDIKWAEFDISLNKGFSTFVPEDVIIYSTQDNCDFYYDHTNNDFKLLKIHSGPALPTDLTNYTCPLFGSPWVSFPLGEFEDFDDKGNGFNETFSYVYGDHKFHILFDEAFTGIKEMYHFTYLNNATFWEQKGFFAQDELTQIYWNGRTTQGFPINATMVKVKFDAQNNTENILRNLFISIDNQYPELSYFDVLSNYFNPIDGDLNIEFQPSEEGTAIFEVYRNNTQESEWSQVTSNNWQDTNPQLLISNIGPMYIVFQTLESGRKLLNLIKSEDQGVTWSNPITITQSFSSDEKIVFAAAAWADVVVVYVHDESGFPEHKLYRSFDEGESFEEPIDAWEISEAPMERPQKLIFSNNGTLFVSYLYNPPLVPDWTFKVRRSDNLGFNWISSFKWENYSTDYNSMPSFKPDLGYDPINDLLHVSCPTANESDHGAQYSVANFTFSTLNMSTGKWSTVNGPMPFFIGLDKSEPKFIITQNKTNPAIVSAIFLNNSEIVGQDIVETYCEIVSTDFGKTWSNPMVSQNEGKILASNLKEIYFLKTESDDHDIEIYYKRKGQLVRTIQQSITGNTINTLDFDGYDDFDVYIAPGNYSYTMRIADTAENDIFQQGWFIADYDAPTILDLNDNWTLNLGYTPTPRLDVNITVKITDEYGFQVPVLKVKKDSASWNDVYMNPTGNDYYYAMILGDQNTDTVQYYVEVMDQASNIATDNDVTPYSYDMPSYSYSHIWQFNTSKIYSHFNTYNVSVQITNDLQYVDDLLFYYSYDGGPYYNKSFNRLGPNFTIEVKNIPTNLAILRYKINLTDKFNYQEEIKAETTVLFYQPSFSWTGSNLFNETTSYSSSQNYTFSITISNLADLNYIDSVVFYYSLDNGTTWYQLVLQHNSPIYSGTLTNISEDTRTLLYEVWVMDIYGTKNIVLTQQQISFYPEIPSITFGTFETLMIIIISIGVGIVVAYGYIRLKGTSRDIIQKQMILAQLYTEMEGIDEREKPKKKEKKQMAIGSTPFTKAYMGIAAGSVILLIIGFLMAGINATLGIFLLAGSLLAGIFGYTILMSRDITANIYFEKIRIGLFLLETFQIVLLFFNILAILDAGARIPWFYYYMIESTYNLGFAQVPKLYVSVIGVFFTSLVLVIIITYMQLRKAVNSLRAQRKEGASDNLLLFNKDQTSSRMITQMGFKTVLFLISVLIAIITTTNLLTGETGMLLLVLLAPFALTCFLILMIHPYFEKKSKKGRKLDDPIPFIDNKKFCTKCGEGVFLADRFCTDCGEQLIHPHKMGTYAANCEICGGRQYESALFCPNCGIGIKKEEEPKIEESKKEAPKK